MITTRQMTARAMAVLSAGLAAGLLLHAPAAGDITSANWVNPTLFHYRVQHMPDIDQKRANLPCNGNIHCVPTCAVNMAMYTANHGFPDMQPGPGYWEGNTNYVAANNAVLLMGGVMQTSCASGGTNGSNANTGLQNWIDVISDVDGLVVNDHLSIGNFSSNHANIGKSLCAGRIGSVSFGYYDIIGDLKGIPLVDRDGGHCTTAVKVRRNGASRDLWVRDPASDEGDNTTQSPFFNNVLPISDLTVIVMPDMDMKTMTAIDYTPGDNTVKLIDGHRTITPAQGYSWSTSLGAVVLIGPQSFLNPTPQPNPFPSPNGFPVLSLAWQDLTGELLTVCSHPSQPPTLHAIDTLSGQTRPVPTILPPTLVCTGRSDNVYVCSGTHISMTLVPMPTPPIPPSPPRTLPHIAQAMAFDDARDDLALVSLPARRLMRIDRSLDGPISDQMIPTFVPMGTQAQIAINPQENGVVYLLTNGSPNVWRLAAGPNGLTATALVLPGVTQPRSIDFIDRGNLLVANNGMLVEFQPAPTLNGPGAWQPVANSVFTGLPAEQFFRITRSRTNFEDGIHDQPGWTKNIDANDVEIYPTAPDCAADIAPTLNLDEVVNVSDLLKVISEWGPCASQVSCIADINDDDVVNVADLLGVIAAWGPCP